MSDEKKCTKTEECCEGKKELTQEELEQVTGGLAHRSERVVAPGIIQVEDVDFVSAPLIK